MYFCITCKKQFNDGMTRFGECPYCGQVSMLAQRRHSLERFTLKENFDRIREIQELINLKNGTKILHDND